MKNIIVLTPLHEERELLADVLTQAGHQAVPCSVGRIGCVRFPSLSLTLGVGGHGKGQFGFQTQHVLDHAGGVDLLVCAGAAGSPVRRCRTFDLGGTQVPRRRDTGCRPA